MRLGRVIGTVVATRKNESLVGFKLLVLDVLDPVTGNPVGDRIVAIDDLGAGPSDTVLYVFGTGARVTLDNRNVAVDAAIVGIVDTVDIQK
jgi:ethanolamine utilization protein EutN